MCEIKFKAVENGEIHDVGPGYPSFPERTFFVGMEGNRYVVDNNSCEKKNEIILLQYTGVHDDEESNEIYDGYIVQIQHNDRTINCKVMREGPGFLLASDELDDGYIWMTDLIESDRDHFWIRSAKIIGNIYENSELLNGGDKACQT